MVNQVAISDHLFVKEAPSGFYYLVSGPLFKLRNNFLHLAFLLTKIVLSIYSVLMKGITWSRDSHGLFDYESRHLTKKTLKAAYEAMIMRSGNELSLVNYDSAQSFQE